MDDLELLDSFKNHLINNRLRLSNELRDSIKDFMQKTQILKLNSNSKTRKLVKKKNRTRKKRRKHTKKRKKKNPSNRTRKKNNIL
jgi:hypothetical protein